MKNKLLINGLPFQKAIEKLNGLSPNWNGKSNKMLNIETSEDIEIVYDILVESATAFVNGRLTDAQVEEIDTYYRAWYGYSIRNEE